MFYLLAGSPAERREHSVGKVLARSATTHGIIARVNICTLAQNVPYGKGPFIPMPEGRDPLAPG